MPVQTGLNIGWKATRWVGLSAQCGYRYTPRKKNIPENYNGLYYSFGASVQLALLTDLYKWLIKIEKPKNLIN